MWFSKSQAFYPVWNLSVSIGDPIEENGFSSFAKELDKIQEDNAVLIIKSAGNDGNNVAVDSQPEKINQGGDSLRAFILEYQNHGYYSVDHHKSTQKQ